MPPRPALTLRLLVAAVATLAVGLGVVAPTGAAPTASPAPATGRLLVTLDRDARAGAGGRAAASALAAGGARVSGPVVPELDLMTVSPRRRGDSPRALAERLRGAPGVARVEVERRYTLRYVPNDPALSVLDTSPGTPPGTTVQWWAAQQGFPRLWDLTREAGARGTGARVAVVDTGIDAAHPELAPRIVRASDRDATPGAGGAGSDENGHGTHVASLACAQADDGVGLAGAGLGCGLLVYKSDLTESSVARSIVDAVRAGADAINLSFGTTGAQPASSAVVAALRLAYRRGVVVVAAAADQPVEEQGDPANVLQPTRTGPDLTRGIGLSVTAADATGARASYAGLGSQISMAAIGGFGSGPGAAGPPGILGAFPGASTSLERGAPPVVPPCACRTTFGGDSRYAYIQGTSMAAPMVAATAALMRRLNPDLRARDVLTILKRTARRPVGTGWTPGLGWGVLDAGAAGEAARLTDRTRPASTARAAGRAAGGRRVLRIAASDPAARGLRASGVARVLLYRATGGRSFRRIAATRSRSFVVTPSAGRTRYRTVAVDRAGNRERLVRTGADVVLTTG